MSNFFKNFPRFQHPQLGEITDITARVKVRDFSTAIKQSVEDGLRPDAIADQYLNDSSKDWVLYICNKVIDPQQMVVLSDQQLTEKIIRQYGSIQQAQRRIVVWNNNWREQTDPVSVAEYNDLPPSLKQLFIARLDNYGNIAGYRRRQIEVFRDTNILDTLTVEDAELAPGDLVDILDGADVEATAEVVSVIDNTIILKNRQGAIGTSIRKINTTTEYQITDWQEDKVISDAEISYYKPITVYEQMVEQNESKRNISIPSISAVGGIQSELKKELA